MMKWTMALILGAFFVGSALPAKAVVFYELTFKSNDGAALGTGALILTADSLSDAYNLGIWSGFGSVLSEIRTPDLGGYGSFTISPSNLSSNSQLQTGAQGQIYTLSAPQSGSGSNTDLFLVLWTQAWQIHSQNYNGPTVAFGSFTIGSPRLESDQAPTMATPLPAAFLLFGSVLGALSLVARRRRKPGFVSA
jgi:hypothetical protein